MNRLFQFFGVILVLGFITALPVQAQYYLCWDLSSGEAWADNGALWYDPDGFNGVAPYAPDWAILKTPGLMKIDSSHMIAVGRLYVGEGYNEFPYYLTGAGAGHVLQTSGDFYYDDYMLLGYWSPGTSTYTLQGGTITQVNRDPDAGAGQLRIGDHGDATMNVTNGSGIDVYQAYIGYGVGSATTGIMTMEDTSTMSVGRLEVGHGSSSGLITGTANATLDLYDTASIIATDYTYAGLWNNSQGTINLHDNSSLTVTNGAHLLVGDSQVNYSINPGEGVGVLNIHDNATVEADFLRIGNNNSGNGTINLSSSTGTANLTAGRIFHGYVGSKGVLNIDDGGVLTQTVGDATGSYWHIGYNALDGGRGNGTVNMNGGVIDRTASTRYIALGYLAADGVWNHNGGTLLNNDAGVIMGREDGFYGTGSNATVNLNGGIFESGWFRTYEVYSLVPTSATLNLNGGLIRATGSGFFLGDAGPDSVLQAVVQSGGAFIDSNGFDLGVTTGLTDGGGGGGLTKQGAGILSLRGANTYTGATDVTGGGLTITSTGSIATSDIKMAAGTRLGIANPAAVGALGTLALGNNTTMEMALTPTAAGPNTITTNTLGLSGTTRLLVGAQGSTLDMTNSYTVISQSALLGGGTINAVSLVRGTTAKATVNPTNVTVAITGTPAAAKLEWSGAGADWDVMGTSNWTNLATVSPDMFYELDNVTFNDNGAANPTVNVVGRVHAGTITESGNTAYTFSGAGEIIAASLTKSGSATLTIENSGGITVTGNTSITGSTLSMGDNSGEGTLAGPVSLADATLDAARYATLRITGVVSDDGSGLTKTGNGTVVLANSANTYTGPTRIQGGAIVATTLADGGTPSSIGASSAADSNLRFSGHGALKYTGPSVTIDRSFIMDGDGWINVDRADTTLTMTGGIHSPTGVTNRLFKIGEGGLDLVSSGYNTIGSELVIYGGRVTLDGPTGTEFLTTGSSFIGDNTDNYGNLVINDADLNVGASLYAGLDGANGDITLNGTARIIVPDYTEFGEGGGDVTLTMNGDSLFSTRYGRIGGIGQGTTPGTVVIEMNDRARFESVTTSVGDGAWINIGERFYTTTVTLNDEASMSSSTHYDLGYGNETDCTVILNGTSSMTANTAMRIGVYGIEATGSLTMNESSEVTLGNELRVGAHGNSATGSLTMNGDSTLSAGSELWIGWDGGNPAMPASGTVTLNDNASITFDTSAGGYWAHVGDNYGEGELILNDNASLTGTGALAVGNWGNGHGILRMSGNSTLSAVGIFIGNFYNQGNGIGEAFLSGNATMASPGSDVEVAWGGTGILHIGDGTPTDNVVVTADTEVLLGWGTASGDSDATLNLNGGGTLVTPLIRSGKGDDVPAPLSSILNFNGGTLKASASSGDFIANGGGSLVFEVNVLGHGAVIDTNGYDIAINTPLLDGGSGALAGDFDSDGDVDGNDFLVWQQGYGTTYDASDREDWETNFGTTGGSSTSGGLTKVGAGILTLNSANTYTGVTTVAEGTLGGTGSIAGDAVVDSGATLGPGQSIGTFSIAGDLDLNGTLLVEYSGATIDLLEVGGDLDLTSASLDFASLGALTNPSYTFLTFAGTRTSDFGSISNLPTGYSIVYGTNNVTLSNSKLATAVPEPAAWAILLIAAIWVGCFRRRVITQ